MLKLWRCQICGDPYLGEEKPVNCPFCGAHERQMVIQAAYVNRVGAIPNLTEATHRNLEAALELEIGNAQFYACAAGKSETDEAKNLFKILGKVESEHASVLCKAMGIKKPAITEADICGGDFQENLAESHRREEGAIKHYGKFLSEAVEPRAQEIFSALVAIESDHLSLSGESMA
ncbi:MAG: ferritin family protein [Candidatus Hydrothermarchaeales archaeon]